MANSPISNINTAQAPGQPPKSPTGVNDRYLVTLDVQGNESLDTSGRRIFPIVANLPERFNMQFASQWDSPFARTSLSDAASAATKGAVSSETIAGVAGAFGIGRLNKYQTAQVWQSSSAMSFEIEMVFRAINNSATDVRDKHIALLKLAAPSLIAGGLLHAPGPTLAGKTSSSIDVGNSREITLTLGRYLKLRDVVITSVSSDVTCLFDADGIPQAMTIALGVQSFFACFTTDDIDGMFKVQG